MQQQLDQDLILNEEQEQEEYKDQVASFKQEQEQEQEYNEFIFNFLKIIPEPKFVLNSLIRRLFFAQKALREELHVFQNMPTPPSSPR